MPQKSFFGCAAALTVCAVLSAAAHIPALHCSHLILDFFLWLSMPPVVDGLFVYGAIRAARCPQAAANGRAVRAVLWVDAAVLVLAFAAHLAWFLNTHFLRLTISPMPF